MKAEEFMTWFEYRGDASVFTASLSDDITLSDTNSHPLRSGTKQHTCPIFIYMRTRHWYVTPALGYDDIIVSDTGLVFSISFLIFNSDFFKF
jgi:hypothetical protein